LLSKTFFDGNGVFFSKNKLLDQKIYKYLSTAPIVNMIFLEIVELVCTNCEVTDDIDILRVQNLIKNIYYANLFIVDRSFDEFENRHFTLKVSGTDLEKGLKEFGYKRLKKLIGHVDKMVYNSLWI
jgi:hypothetical protein